MNWNKDTPAGIQPLPNFNYHKDIIEEQIQAISASSTICHPHIFHLLFKRVLAVIGYFDGKKLILYSDFLFWCRR